MPNIAVESSSFLFVRVLSLYSLIASKHTRIRMQTWASRGMLRSATRRAAVRCNGAMARNTTTNPSIREEGKPRIFFNPQICHNCK